MRSTIFVHIISALACCFLAACGGGGGGGGGGGSSSSGGSSSGWISSVSTAQADVYRTAEYNSQAGLEQINAAEAYALLNVNNKTVAGAGVEIAILDSGVQINHDEISANYISSGSYDYVNNDSNPSDDNGHGTEVASIAAGVKDGRGMQGVAYDSDIIAIKVLASNGLGTYSNLTQGINLAISDDVGVINMSLTGGSGSASLRDALIAAKNADILMVAATGNSSATQPEYPARYASDSDLQGYVIAVASVGTSTSTTDISTFSNKCGDAANYCMVAPGYQIYDAQYNSDGTTTNGYGYDSGTSMAAPAVSGAAAVLRAAWPFLTANQVSNILLSTATDLGTSGVDAIYGHGLLNLYQAVQAQGQNLFVYGSSVSSGGYSVGSSSLVTDPIFGDAFVSNVAPQLAAGVFFDDYGRDYKAFINQKISARSNYNIASNLTALAFNNYNTQTIPLSFGNNAASQLKFQVKSYNDKSAPNSLGLKFATVDKSSEDKLLNLSNGFSFSQNFAANSDNNFVRDVKAGFAVNSDEAALVREDKFNNFGFISVSNFAGNPFQSFVSNQTNSSNNVSSWRNFNQIFVGSKFFDKKFALNFSQQSSYDSTTVLSKIANLQNRISDLNLAYLPSEATKLAVSFGNLNEFNNNFLNSKAAGAFEAAGNARTSYFKVSASHKIISDFFLISSFSEGKTTMQGNDLGIFRNYSDIRSRSASLGLVNEKIFGGRLGMIYSEPMRVYSGKAEINIPVARDLSGNVQRYSSTVSLKPNGKEQDLELFYSTNLALRRFHNPLLRFNLVAQKQPGNFKDAATAYLGFVSFNGKF